MEIKSIVGESLQDTYAALALTSELPSLQENAMDAATDTRGALESVVSGLAWYIPKVSGAAHEGRLAAEADSSARHILTSAATGDPLLRKAEEYIKDAALYSDIATKNRDWALVTGTKLLPDLEIAYGGLSTFTAKTEQMLPLVGTSLTNGIRRHLEKAMTPLAALDKYDHRIVQTYRDNLGAGIADALSLASCFKTVLRQVETGYSIEGFCERFRDTLAILEDSKNKNIQDFAECLEISKQKITEEDVDTLRALLKSLNSGMKEMRDSINQREDLQAHTGQAIEIGEDMLKLL